MLCSSTSPSHGRFRLSASFLLSRPRRQATRAKANDGREIRIVVVVPRPYPAAAVRLRGCVVHCAPDDDAPRVFARRHHCRRAAHEAESLLRAQRCGAALGLRVDAQHNHASRVSGSDERRCECDAPEPPPPREDEDEDDEAVVIERLPMALLPSKFAIDYVTLRQNQTHRGMCWDFATVGFLEQSYRQNGVQNDWLAVNEENG